MSVNAYDYTGFYTIVLQNATSQAIIRKIFEDCWKLYIANVNILVPTEGYKTILSYTFFPFTPDECEGVRPTIHNYFRNNTFLLNAPIFPDKFRNFFKCPLKIATHNVCTKSFNISINTH